MSKTETAEGLMLVTEFPSTQELSAKKRAFPRTLLSLFSLSSLSTRESSNPSWGPRKARICSSTTL